MGTRVAQITNEHKKAPVKRGPRGQYKPRNASWARIELSALDTVTFLNNETEEIWEKTQKLLSFLRYGH
jgi:hypothetical protein